MSALHNYPWLTWTWILAVVARIQIGSYSGVLEIIEGICHSNFSTIDEVSEISAVSFRSLLSLLRLPEHGHSRG